MTNDETNARPDAGLARSAILARIASAIGPVDAHVDPDAEWQKLARDYIRDDSLAGAAVLQLFEHRLTDYGARLFHCGVDQLLQTIGQVLGERGVKRIVIPPGIPGEWLPGGISFTEDQQLPYGILDKCDGVLTTATFAIAATGSIVLQHGPGQGRRALTLIPDYHLCIVNAEHVVETVPAAFARLDPARATTFISGPSATADIEMTRIKGVHGPRFMDVVLVSPAS